MKPRDKRRGAEIDLALAVVADQAANVARTRVSPVRLIEAVGTYVEWEAYAYWIRAIVESQGKLPEWIRAGLGVRCPGFFTYEGEYRLQHPDEEPFLWLRLMEWINTRIFAEAAEEGWLDAVLYDAARDPRSKRAGNHWLRCDEQWQRKTPDRYPSFEEWCHEAGLETPRI